MKKSTRMLVLVVVFLMTVSMFAGCAKQPVVDADTNAPAAEEAAAEEPAAEGERLNIGFIVPTLDAQFWNNYKSFVEEGAEQLGCDVTFVNADNNADTNNKHIEDLVSMGVDGLVFVPYWASGRKAVTDTNIAGIPVMSADCFIDGIEPQDEFDNYIAFVGPNDEDSGYQMAFALFNSITPAADGKKYVGVIQGTPGTSVAINREKGFDRALAENADVEVVGRVNGNFVRDESQQAMEDLYQAHPEMQGVWCANGGTATGAMTAIKNAGKVPGKDVMVVAMDLNPENVDAVANGELLFDIGGHWLQGGFALVMMYDYLNGYEVPKEKANVVLDLLPLTIDKIDQFNKDFPDGVPAYDFKANSKTYNPDAESAYFEMKYSE